VPRICIRDKEFPAQWQFVVSARAVLCEKAAVADARQPESVAIVFINTTALFTITSLKLLDLFTHNVSA
jgi:hypothetical protein